VERRLEVDGWRVGRRGQAEEMCPVQRQCQHLVGFLESATLFFSERQLK
jgi:ribosome modulation factor